MTTRNDTLKAGMIHRHTLFRANGRSLHALQRNGVVSDTSLPVFQAAGHVAIGGSAVLRPQYLDTPRTMFNVAPPGAH